MHDSHVVASSSNRSNSSSSNNNNSNSNNKNIDILSVSLIALIITITIVTMPKKALNGAVTLAHVWYYGWITAISTGLGALPFYFVQEPNKFWIGVSNAVAGGMMIAASYSLASEGCTYDDNSFTTNQSTNMNNMNTKHSITQQASSGKYNSFGYTDNYDSSDPYSQLHSPLVLMISGFLLGVVFIISTKTILEEYEDLKLYISSGEVEAGKERRKRGPKVSGSSAQKMVLIVFVMTLHSITEGIGIGVSFGGKTGMHLGQVYLLNL